MGKQKKWLSGRKRQTVNLLGKLSLVRIQPFSKISLHRYFTSSNSKYNSHAGETNLAPTWLHGNKTHASTGARSAPSFKKYNKASVKVLCLNFLRKRFFPLLLLKAPGSSRCITLFSLSLGLLAKVSPLGKPQLKKKSAYLGLVYFIKRALSFLNIAYVRLVIKGIPKHLTSILEEIFAPSAKLVINPFIESKDKLSTHSNKENRLKINFVTFAKP